MRNREKWAKLKTRLLSGQQGKKCVNWTTEEVFLWCKCSTSIFTTAFLFSPLYFLNICKRGWLFWVLQINPGTCIFYWTLRSCCLVYAEKRKRTSPKGSANLETKARRSRPAPQPVCYCTHGLTAQALTGAAGEWALQGQWRQKCLSAIAGDAVCSLARCKMVCAWATRGQQRDTG